MARGFVKSSNLFESQDGTSALNILNNLAGDGISEDIRLFANNLEYTQSIGFDQYKIENANDVEFALDPANSSIMTSEGVIEDYTRFVVPDDAQGLLPFTNETIVYVIDNEGEKVYYIVDHSDTLSVFSLFEWNPTTKTKGSMASWANFIDLDDQTIYRNDGVVLENLTNFSKDRLATNDGSNPDFSLVIIDDDLTDDIPGTLEFADPDNNFLKAAGYPTYTDDIDATINQFYYKEGASILDYRHNDFSELIEIDGVIRITNDNKLEYSSETADEIPGIFILANGQAIRAFSETDNPWNQYASGDAANTLVSPNTSNSLANLYTVRETNAEVLKFVITGPQPTFVIDETIQDAYGQTENKWNFASSYVASNIWTHKAEVTINGETFFLLMTANNVPKSL